jgi:C4-type Zn-finger protein
MTIIKQLPLPNCPVCADSIVAAAASAYVAADNVISYLWTCDTCGYGFVTKNQHTLRSDPHSY